jgi:indole-3-glycerol phosphate synthase
VQRAAAAGFDAVLVGESFVRSSDPADAGAFVRVGDDVITWLSSRKSFVKICGITSVKDARVVVDSGADAVGLIFASSVRQLTLEQAHEIAAATRGSILRVGVFRPIPTTSSLTRRSR